MNKMLVTASVATLTVLGVSAAHTESRRVRRQVDALHDNCLLNVVPGLPGRIPATGPSILKAVLP